MESDDVVFVESHEVLPPHETLASQPLTVEEGSPGGPISITFWDASENYWLKDQGKLELLWEAGHTVKDHRSVKDRLDAWARGQMDKLNY
jgi:hypothetical protein